jgi:hypothetical protein
MLLGTGGVAFSPDGKYIAFSQAFQLYTMRLNGADLERQSETTGFSPTWSSNSSTLFYSGAPTADPDDYHSVIFRTALGGDPVQVTGDADHDGTPTWGRLAGLLDVDEVIDKAAPAVVTDSELVNGLGGSSTRARQLVAARFGQSRIPFLVADASGVRRVLASVAKKVDGGCRYLTGTKLGRKRSCSDPQYFKFRNAPRWRRQMRALSKGKYYVRFKTKDRKGHVTKHPKRRVVRLK